MARDGPYFFGLAVFELLEGVGHAGDFEDDDGGFGIGPLTVGRGAGTPPEGAAPGADGTAALDEGDALVVALGTVSGTGVGGGGVSLGSTALVDAAQRVIPPVARCECARSHGCFDTMTRSAPKAIATTVAVLTPRTKSWRTRSFGSGGGRSVVVRVTEVTCDCAGGASLGRGTGGPRTGTSPVEIPGGGPVTAGSSVVP